MYLTINLNKGMRLISWGSGFAAELRGVDLIDVATNDAAYCAVREAFGCRRCPILAAEEHSVILFRNYLAARELKADGAAHGAASRK
jgi:hypothetical protein